MNYDPVILRQLLYRFLYDLIIRMIRILLSGIASRILRRTAVLLFLVQGIVIQDCQLDPQTAIVLMAGVLGYPDQPGLQMSLTF